MGKIWYRTGDVTLLWR